MAVTLRLMRMGKKKQPTFRIVAADKRKPRNGRFIEILGHYDARREPSVIKVDNERAVHWLRHGAQPSETVGKLLTLSGAMAQFKGEKAPEGAERYQLGVEPAGDAAEAGATTETAAS
ncbi:MAG: 30S ribosomal protein S16 [Acidimicrobiales bacterium]|nr:30S ribosomal protein S16 [Acidimicrobiales bacterium]